MLQEHLRNEQRDDDVCAERPVLVGVPVHGGDPETGEAVRCHAEGESLMKLGHTF